MLETPESGLDMIISNFATFMAAQITVSTFPVLKKKFQAHYLMYSGMHIRITMTPFMK